MKLWQHQTEALARLDAAIRAGHKRICLVAPTGAGKTRIATERIQRSGVPTVFYTHRKMLLEQTAKRFSANGIYCGVRAAGWPKALLEDIQLAMIQTEASAVLKHKRRDVHEAGEVIIDEAHNNSADKALQLIGLHGAAVIIGLTATPLGIGHVYDRLIEAGTKRELFARGVLVPAHHYAPDEPSSKLCGRVKFDGGECGIPTNRREMFVHQVAGRVIEHLKLFNARLKPTLLFGPDVAGSIYLCNQLNSAGISAAHIDGEICVVDGRQVGTTQQVRDEIAERSQCGDIKVVCNRFVLREGVDWPWIAHGVFATIFGGLTSYLQAGGRLLRSAPGIRHVTIQDHGGNWWRHGSLNADRAWCLSWNDRIATGMRMQGIREGAEPMPIVCPKCSSIREWGRECHKCGFAFQKNSRPVLQTTGKLLSQPIPQFLPRRTSDSESLKRAWCARVRNTLKSNRADIRNRTLAQIEAAFAMDNNWIYPSRDFPMMPRREIDWFMPVCEVELR